MAHETTIRTATRADISRIRELFWALDNHSIAQQPQHFQRGERSEEYLVGLIEGEQSAFLLACEGGEVIGFSLIFEKEVKNLSLLVPCRYGYIQDFVVDEAHRNRGVGALMLHASKQWSKARGLEYLRLSVLPENADGLRFYEKQGMEKQMITMECPLS